MRCREIEREKEGGIHREREDRDREREFEKEIAREGCERDTERDRDRMRYDREIVRDKE